MLDPLHSNIAPKLRYQYYIRDAALRLNVPVYYLFEDLSHEEQLRVACDVIKASGVLKIVKSIYKQQTYVSRSLNTNICKIQQYQYYIHETALHLGIPIINNFEDLSHEEQLRIACKIIQSSDDWNKASAIREQYNCVKDNLETIIGDVERLSHNLDTLFQRIHLFNSTSLVNLENPFMDRDERF
ncbi:MAG: hypothetical protein ACKO34_06385 [Vampirovibrionales bacterium]